MYLYIYIYHIWVQWVEMYGNCLVYLFKLNNEKGQNRTYLYISKYTIVAVYRFSYIKRYTRYGHLYILFCIYLVSASYVITSNFFSSFIAAVLSFHKVGGITCSRVDEQKQWHPTDSHTYSYIIYNIESGGVII